MQRTIVFLLTAVFSFAVPYSSSHATDFTLLFSNDIRGETEPCG